LQPAFEIAAITSLRNDTSAEAETALAAKTAQMTFFEGIEGPKPTPYKDAIFR